MTAGPLDITDHATWAGTRRPLGATTGLPPSLYTDPAIHAAELDRVFERAWVCVGLTAELDRPGAVLARPVGRRAILVTRNGDGQLRGFLNSCRHRGTELAESDCTVRGTIRCPYHRWGYDLDGTLVSTPRFDDVPGAAAAPTDGLDLVPVRADAAGCLLFACLDPATPPLASWLGDLPDRLAGYRLDRWQRADGLSIEIDANWKLISENYQEYYHLPWVHPGLATVSRVDDHYRYQGPGMYCGQTTTPVTDGDGSTWLSLPPMAGLDDSDSVSGRHIAVFPNVLISILPNHAFVLRLEPDGPGRTREHCTWLLPPDGATPTGDADQPAARRSGFAALRQFWLDVNGEDIEIVERSQRGLSRGAVPAGPLAPRFEEPLRRFHTMLADLCTVPEPADLPIPAGDHPGTDVELGGKPNPHPPSIENETETKRG